MKFVTIVLSSMLFATIQATFNFRNTCSSGDRQMSSLSRSIQQVKSVAQKYGHTEISAKCDEASRHLSNAQSSWNKISTSYVSSPWAARSSPHASVCQSGLSSCGSCIDWIHSRPEVISVPDYHVPISSCVSGHQTCQSTCGQVWNIPTPPGQGPQPSGYRLRTREASKGLCPSSNEVACPITHGALGHECVDVSSEITSCGGCTTKNQGENCMTIQGADEVGCEAGICRVFSPLVGYVINPVTKRPEALQ